MTPPYTVHYRPAAQRAFARIADTLIDWGAEPSVAIQWISTLRDFCEALGATPHKGTKRDDIAPGLRTVGFRRRATIVFQVDDHTRIVRVLGIYYAGQNWIDRSGKK